jgi:CheY-like chemotaxis protein
MPTQRPYCDPLSVLIVDPHEDGAETLATVLRFYGHDVAVAPNGPVALTTAAQSPPDVVIIEPRLPGQDGWEVVRRLRLNGSRPICIAVSTLGQREDRLRSEAAGISFHLLKPAEPETLLAILADIARTRHGQLQPA